MNIDRDKMIFHSFYCVFLAIEKQGRSKLTSSNPNPPSTSLCLPLENKTFQKKKNFVPLVPSVFWLLFFLTDIDAKLTKKDGGGRGKRGTFLHHFNALSSRIASRQYLLLRENTEQQTSNYLKHNVAIYLAEVLNPE